MWVVAFMKSVILCPWFSFLGTSNDVRCQGILIGVTATRNTFFDVIFLYRCVQLFYSLFFTPQRSVFLTECIRCSSTSRCVASNFHENNLGGVFFISRYGFVPGGENAYVGVRHHFRSVKDPVDRMPCVFSKLYCSPRLHTTTFFRAHPVI